MRLDHIQTLLATPRENLFRACNRWLVSLYKVFGFIVLLSIVVGMSSYLAVNAFFLISRSWIVPVILTPQHERVITVNTTRVELTQKLDSLRTERVSITAELSHIERAIALIDQYLSNFAQALDAEETQLKERRDRLAGLAKQLADATHGAKATGGTFSTQNREDLERQYASQLITREEYLRGMHAATQLAFGDVSQREKYQDVLERLQLAENQLKAQAELKARMRDVHAGGGHFDTDVLGRERAWLDAEIERSGLAAKLPPLRTQLSRLEEAIGEQERTVAALQASPYARAAAERVTIAFVPYDNMSEARAGARVYGCYLSFVACKRIGSVKRVLDGEVTSRHPMTGRDVRGVMVEVELDEPAWAEENALMLNRAPLLI